MYFLIWRQNKPTYLPTYDHQLVIQDVFPSSWYMKTISTLYICRMTLYCKIQVYLWSSGLVVKALDSALDSQSSDSEFKTTGWLQDQLSLSSFQGWLSEYQELLGTSGGVVKSKLSPRSGYVTLWQLNSIY